MDPGSRFACPGRPRFWSGHRGRTFQSHPCKWDQAAHRLLCERSWTNISWCVNIKMGGPVRWN